MRYCHYCGHVVPDDARFCPSCGKDLTLSAVKQQETTTQQPTSRPTFTISGKPMEQDKPVSARLRTQTPKAPTRKKETEADSKLEKKQSSLWGCTIAVLIVALLAGGLLFTYNQLFDRSNYNNILAPKDDEMTEEQLPTTEQEPTETTETATEQSKEVHREQPPVVIAEEEEHMEEAEEPEELPEEETNQLEQLIKNHSQED